MEQLIEKFRRKIAAITTDFVRSAMDSIHWDARLVGIKGARGIGKTTLMLQHIKLHYQDTLDTVLYVSLDDLWFAEHGLPELADNFAKIGGRRLYLDEVHKYPDWSNAIKNIFDDYPELSIVFTGSFLLKIHNARADLSRRAVVHSLQGLSFREYLRIRGIADFSAVTWETLLENHQAISSEVLRQIKPLQYFPQYLHSGYYPFFLEGEDTYGMWLEEVVLMLLEVELPLLRNIEIAYVNKLKQLLSIISESSPFIPNITKLSERIKINRQTLLGYLHYLEEARLINSLYREGRGIGVLQKPDKIFLENSNLMYLFQGVFADKGNLRETFVANQLDFTHEVNYSRQGDFLIDRKYMIEVGGKNKTRTQIKETPDAYVAADNIEYGSGRKIPLWLFGFLY